MLCLKVVPLCCLPWHRTAILQWHSVQFLITELSKRLTIELGRKHFSIHVFCTNLSIHFKYRMFFQRFVNVCVISHQAFSTSLRLVMAFMHKQKRKHAHCWRWAYRCDEVCSPWESTEGPSSDHYVLRFSLTMCYFEAKHLAGIKIHWYLSTHIRQNITHL